MQQESATRLGPLFVEGAVSDPEMEEQRSMATVCLEAGQGFPGEDWDRMIIHEYYGSFPHSLLSTSKIQWDEG